MGVKAVGGRHWTRVLVEPSRTLNIIISVLLQAKTYWMTPNVLKSLFKDIRLETGDDYVLSLVAY